MSAVRDELIEWRAAVERRRQLREERMKTRTRCVFCGERVGQCKMRKPK